jgi:hypothetical protein
MDTHDADALKAKAINSKGQDDRPPPFSPFSPAWERDGRSLKIFVITIYQVLRHPVRTFAAPGSTSRKAATSFGIVLGTFGLILDLMNVAPFHDEIAINYLIVALCLAASPFVAWGLIYVNAGIIQFFLDLTKSGARGFDKTYRVAAYVGGAAVVFTTIPLLGDLIGFLLWLVVMIYALAATHRVPKRKVLLAVAAMYIALALSAFVLAGSC